MWNHPVFLISFLFALSQWCGAAPQRIISNTLLSDEIIQDLINHYNANNLVGRIIALSEKSSDKKYSNIRSPFVAPPTPSNLEAILSLKPDLVILASYNRVEFKEALRKHKISILELNKFDTISSVEENIRKIAEAIGNPEEGLAMIKAFKHKLETLTQESLNSQKQKKSLPPKILVLDPMGATMGKGTLWDDLLARLHLRNWAQIVGLSAWPRIPDELLLNNAFEKLVVASNEENTEESKSLPKSWELFFKRHPWPLALKKNHISTTSKDIIIIPERLAYTCSHYVVDLGSLLLKRL